MFDRLPTFCMALDFTSLEPGGLLVGHWQDPCGLSHLHLPLVGRSCIGGFRVAVGEKGTVLRRMHFFWGEILPESWRVKNIHHTIQT